MAVPRMVAFALLALGVAPLLLLGVGAAPASGEESSLRDRQWGLERIRAPEAWDVSRGQGTVVAIVDSGVDLGHPDLAPRLLRDGDGRVVGRDFVDGGEPQDVNGHGTLVAGVAAAAADAGVGGHGVTGVAPRTRIMPVRVLDHEGRGRVSDVDEGIRWAADRGAHVINLSLENAVPIGGGLVSSSLDEAIEYAWRRGAVVVAASGNTGTPFTDYRSSTPVLLVGATDRNDRRALFSDAGRSDMVVAPGVDILTTRCRRPCDQDPERGYATSSGTSLAAPHAAGAVALLRAAGADHEQAVRRLRETAEPVRSGGADISSGHGRIDVAAALGVDEPVQREDATQPRDDGQRSEPSPDASAADDGDADPSTSPGGSAGADREDEAAPPEDGADSADPDAADEGDPDTPDAPDASDADAPDGEADSDETGETQADEAETPREPVDAVDVPRGPSGPTPRFGGLEALAAGLVLGSGVAVWGARRYLGGL